MTTMKRIFPIFMALLLTACALPGMVSLSPSKPAMSVSKPELVQVPANATPTATPFMPLAPTQSFRPTNAPGLRPSASPTLSPSSTPLPAWGNYPGPTIWPDIDIPSPVEPFKQPDGQINILLLGSDQRPNDGGFRTDTILLLTIDPKAGTANLTSFPRDLYVYIPGWTIQRINTAMGHGGIDLLYDTMEYNFGVHPDHYVFINFWSFKDVINQLGGIYVDVAVPLTDQRDGYGDYTVTSGTHYMDGDLALWYVRARYTTSDFERGKRQQEVIMAIFNRLLSLDALKNASNLYDIYRQNVTTDLTFGDLTPFLPLATKLDTVSGVNHYFIGRDQVTSWLTTMGAQVLIPNREPVLEVMRQALNVPES